jgi:hypothetical protein
MEKECLMKKALLVLFAGLGCLVLPLGAQTAFTAMSLNGATGLYVIPTARIGFADANLGLTGGYHTIIYRPGGGTTELNHLIQANISFLKMFEVSGTFDLQPKNIMGPDPNDILTGFKFQLPIGAIPIAVGSNFQWRNVGRESDHWAIQVYGAVSYPADIFGWPSETTLVIGHTFREEEGDSNIDFGMGFDLIILPKYLKNFLHLLIDFSNFSYSADPYGPDAWPRGVLNTGVRVDLSQIPVLSKFNFAVDMFLADAFDDKNIGGGRSFGLGVNFGMSF